MALKKLTVIRKNPNETVQLGKQVIIHFNSTLTFCSNIKIIEVTK
jgi:hypothetical protein